MQSIQKCGLKQTPKGNNIMVRIDEHKMRKHTWCKQVLIFLEGAGILIGYHNGLAINEICQKLFIIQLDEHKRVNGDC